MKNFTNNGEDGFSLLELVIAIGVILVLSMGVSIGYGKYQNNARQSVVESAAQQSLKGAVAYETAGTGSAEDAVEAYNKSSKAESVSVALERGENGCMRVVATYKNHDNEAERTYNCSGGAVIPSEDDDNGNEDEKEDDGSNHEDDGSGTTPPNGVRTCNSIEGYVHLKSGWSKSPKDYNISFTSDDNLEIIFSDDRNENGDMYIWIVEDYKGEPNFKQKYTIKAHIDGQVIPIEIVPDSEQFGPRAFGDNWVNYFNPAEEFKCYGQGGPYIDMFVNKDGSSYVELFGNVMK